MQSGALSGDVVDHLLLLMNSVFVPMSICCVLVPMNLSRAVLMAVALRVICCTQCYCGCGGVLDRAVLMPTAEWELLQMPLLCLDAAQAGRFECRSAHPGPAMGAQRSNLTPP